MAMKTPTQARSQDRRRQPKLYLSLSRMLIRRDLFNTKATQMSTNDNVPQIAISRTSSKLVISQPSVGYSPTGFPRIHVELLPREVGRLIGYDPRVLVMKQRKPGSKGKAETLPHNVSKEVIALQNAVQRSIDKNRVAQMAQYLADAMTKGKFADWGAIELVTANQPDLSRMKSDHTAALDSDADYFIADGQHRYCALLDFIHNHPQYADRFTQGVNIAIMPENKLVEWAGQEFHDRNYFSVPVRAGKALSVDSRDPVNSLAKALGSHSTVESGGGVATERDALLKNDPRFATHATLHRFVRGFLFGRPGLDKGVDTRVEIGEEEAQKLDQYMTLLNLSLPWASDTEDRDQYVTRTSAVMSALAVVGHDLFLSGQFTPDQITSKMKALTKINWSKTNPEFIGVLGSEKDGMVAPNASRQSIDSTIRFIRDKLKIQPAQPQATQPA